MGWACLIYQFDQSGQVKYEWQIQNSSLKNSVPVVCQIDNTI